MEKINDIVLVDINEIIRNNDQPRKEFDEELLKELSESIKRYGILQPITLRKKNDKYEIVMGERRYRASKMLGLKEIPSIILDVNDEDSLAASLIENIQRVDLNFIEEAKSIKDFIDLYHLSQEEVSKKLGKSQSTISNKLRILKLSERELNLLLVSSLTERHARALLKIEDEELRFTALNYIIDKKLNVKQSETYIKKLLTKKKEPKYSFDYKIYENTIRKTYRDIKKINEDIEMKKFEDDDFIHMEIIIPKK